MKFEAIYHWTMTCTGMVEARDEDDAWDQADALGSEMMAENESSYVENTLEVARVNPYREHEPTMYQPTDQEEPRGASTVPAKEPSNAFEEVAEKKNCSQPDEERIPLYDLKSGRIAAQIWDTEMPGGEIRYSVSLLGSSNYVPGRSDRVPSFEPADIPNALQLLTIAQNILREELGQDLSSEVKVIRNKDIPQARKQTI